MGQCFNARGRIAGSIYGILILLIALIVFSAPVPASPILPSPAAPVSATITIRAKSTLYNNKGPTILVRLNGMEIAPRDLEVRSRDLSDYVFKVPNIPPPLSSTNDYRIDVAYTNHVAGRSLTIESVQINNFRIFPANPHVVFDPGFDAAAFDWIGVSGGRELITQAGALRLPVPLAALSGKDVEPSARDPQNPVIPSSNVVSLYSENNFDGTAKQLGNGIYQGSGLPEVASLKIPAKKIVRLCDDALPNNPNILGAGQCITLKPGSYSSLPEQIRVVKYAEVQDISGYQRFLIQGAAVSGVDIKGPDGIIYPDFSFAGKKQPYPSAYTVTMNITAKGGKPDDDKDDAKAIQAIIDSIPANTSALIMLPPGRLILDHTINIGRGNITLRGAGMDKTILVPRFDGQTTTNEPGTTAGYQLIKPAIDINRIGGNVDIDQAALRRPIIRGDKTLYVDTASIKSKKSVCTPGSTLQIVGNVPAGVMNGLSSSLQTLVSNDKWHAYGYITQLVQVVAANEDCSQLTIDRPIYEDIPLDARPMIWKPRNVVSNVGLEDFTIKQDTGISGINGIHMTATSESWIRNVHVARIGNWPINVARSIDYEIHDSIFENSLSACGSGGVGYVHFGGNDGVVANTVVQDARHLVPSGQNLAFYKMTLRNIDLNFHSGFQRHILFDASTVEPPQSGHSSKCAYGHGVWTPANYESNSIHSPTGRRNVIFNSRFDIDQEAVWLGGGDTKNWVIAYNTFKNGNGPAVSLRKGADKNIFFSNQFTLGNYKKTGWYNPDLYFSPDMPRPSAGGVMFLQNGAIGNQFAENSFRGLPNSSVLFTGAGPGFSTSYTGNENNQVLSEGVVQMKPMAAFSPSLYAWQRAMKGRPISY